MQKDKGILVAILKLRKSQELQEIFNIFHSLRTLFESLDKDGSGSITKEEFSRFSGKKYKKTSEEIKRYKEFFSQMPANFTEMFQQMNMDDDDEFPDAISLKEWMQFYVRRKLGETSRSDLESNRTLQVLTILHEAERDNTTNGLGMVSFQDGTEIDEIKFCDEPGRYDDTPEAISKYTSQQLGCVTSMQAQHFKYLVQKLDIGLSEAESDELFSHVDKKVSC